MVLHIDPSLTFLLLPVLEGVDEDGDDDDDDGGGVGGGGG